MSSWCVTPRAAAVPVGGADTRLVYIGTHDTAPIDRDCRMPRTVATHLVKHAKLPATALSDDAAALTQPPVLRACVLAAACLFTTRGVPQVLAGDECLEHRSKPWPHAPHLDTRRGDTVAAAVVACYHDLIGLRRNLGGTTAGLSGPHLSLLHHNPHSKVLVWHRWDEGGPRDDTIVVANFGNNDFNEYRCVLVGSAAAARGGGCCVWVLARVCLTCAGAVVGRLNSPCECFPWCT